MYTREYTVQYGDTIKTIALAQLGSASFAKRIWEMNKAAIPNPNWLNPGVRLVIPR